MSEYNVLNDTQVTTAANLLYTETHEEQTGVNTTIEGVNDALMNSWHGVAGDAFMCMANVVEDTMRASMGFTDNCGIAMDDLVVRFTDEDEARKDSLDTVVATVI